MDEETDFLKLSVEDRCVHKLWKARVHGYEEATKLFRKIDEEKSPEWNKYLGLIKKFVSDNNVAAQEKGLEASLAYIENAFVATKTAGEVMPIIISKCIGATKAKIKDLAIQITLMYIEIEKQDIVLEELLKGAEHKNPKISAACITAMTQGLREFGSKVMNIKLILKRLPALLEDRDKNVRDETKSLTVEIFKWVGPILNSQLTSLKPIQLQELEVEFEKVKGEKPIVQRYLRSQQAKQSKLVENAVYDGEEGGNEADNDAVDEVDPMDLIQPVDILSKLPKDFYEKLEAKKWQERKEALDCLEQLLSNAPKLETGDYGDLIRAVKKVITKDSNVVLVGIGAKCMAFLGKGLKKRFQPYALHCLPSLLEKFKEKKQTVVVPLRDSVDSIYDSITLEAIQEDVLASMDSKNPAVKAETVAFLTRCFTKCNSLMLNKKLLKTFTMALLKTLNESDPVVRDNSAEAIGTAWKVVGEKTILPFLTEVDSIKIGKIREASEKAVIVAKVPKIIKKSSLELVNDTPTKPTPKAGSINPKPVSRKPVNKTATFIKKTPSSTALNKVGKSSKSAERDYNDDDIGEKFADEQCNETAKSGKPASVPSSASSQGSMKPKGSLAAKKNTVPTTKRKKEEDVDSSPLLKVNNVKMQRNLDENKLKVLKWNFTTPREEYIEQLRDQMNTAGVNKTLITNMFHPDFKYHLKAIDALSEDVANNTVALISNLDLILKWMTIRFFDTNPSVILRGLEYLNMVFRRLAEEGYNMMEMEAASFLPYLVVKTGDPKDAVRNLVKEIFDAVGSVYPISKLFTYIMEGVKSKNARQRTGCLEQLSRLIENYGLSVCQPSPTAALKEIAKQISDRDNSVRNAALNCVIVAYFIAGDKIRQMIGQISDKDMSLLEERIKRASKTRPVATVKPTQCSPIKRNPPPEQSPPQINNNTYDCGSEDEMMPNDEDVYEDIEPVPKPTNVSPMAESQQSYRRKHFGLDLNVIEAIEATSIIHPKPNLIEYDDKYLTETVLPIPHTRQITSPSSYSCNAQTVIKNYSSPPKPNNLEAWISTIGNSTNLTDIMKAIEQVESVLLVEDKRKELNGLETHFVAQFINQLHHLNSIEDPDFVKCYRHLFSLLMKLLSYPNHAIKITDCQLQQLLNQLINLLIEKRLEYVGDWNMFQKVVNNLVLKILERSDHTAVICALLRMLYDSVASSNTDQHYQELIMKCTWKTIKYIPGWNVDLDYNKVLTEIHRFLNDFPSTWWKRQPQDTPLRTYKTMVHTLVTVRGAEILTVVNFVPGFSEQSELFHYINKLLRHMKLEEKTDEVPDKTKYSMHGVQHEELAQILKKIGNKEETQQGLIMLYEFKKNYPEININQFLSKTSKYFQQYVLKGLEAVQAEKDGEVLCDCFSDDKCAINSEQTNYNILGVENGAGEGLESDAQRYQEKLKMLQMRAGWDQHKKPGSAPSINAEQPSNLIPTLRITSPPQKLYRDADGDGTASLEQLRRKLSQLKGGN